MPDHVQQHSTITSSKARSMAGLSKPRQALIKILNFSMDLIFPPRCVGCGRIDTYWCNACEIETVSLDFPGLHSPAPGLKKVAVTAKHEGKLREAVQALKYQNTPVLAKTLGERLTACLQRQDWTIDIIIPVPLHTTRLKERGYNQSELLAQNVALNMGIPCRPEALQRIRQTQSQVTMTAAERVTNMQDAFSANCSLSTGKQVLLIDDVYTTGSTMSACATALLTCGVQAVYGLTVTAARI